MRIRPYADETDRQQVVDLWLACGLVTQTNDPMRDIERKLAKDPELFLVAVDDDGVTVLGTIMAGYDGHRGWFNYMASSPDKRHQGIGTALVRKAEQKLLDLGCPKINLQVRRSNKGVIAFYESTGFTEDDVLSMGKRLISDNTPDDRAAEYGDTLPMSCC